MSLKREEKGDREQDREERMGRRERESIELLRLAG